jgi:hypothetical protein
MNERKRMMEEKRKKKEQSIADAVRKAEEEKKAEEEEKKRKIERALKAATLSGETEANTWEKRVAYEKELREQRRKARRELLKKMIVPLTTSMEKSVKTFIDVKGIDAVKAPPPPPKDEESKPTKRTETPEEVAARIAEEARIIKEQEEKRAREREEKKKEMLVPDPVAVALIERLEKQRKKFLDRTMLKRTKELQKAEEEAQKEQLRLAKLMESTVDPVIKPTNAQIAHDLEVL